MSKRDGLEIMDGERRLVRGTLLRAGVVDADGDVFTEDALRHAAANMAASKTMTLHLDEPGSRSVHNAVGDVVDARLTVDGRLEVDAELWPLPRVDVAFAPPLSLSLGMDTRVDADHYEIAPVTGRFARLRRAWGWLLEKLGIRRRKRIRVIDKIRVISVGVGPRK